MRRDCPAISHRMRSRGTAVVLRDGKALLVRDKGVRQFSLPGGAPHVGEPFLSAAARELYEETDLHPRSAQALLTYVGSANEHHVFIVGADGVVRLKEELEAFLWWDGTEEVHVRWHALDILAYLGATREDVPEAFASLAKRLWTCPACRVRVGHRREDGFLCMGCGRPFQEPLPGEREAHEALARIDWRMR